MQLVITTTVTAVPTPDGHRFAKPAQDVPEACICGAAFYDGYNLQAVKLAHLAHFAAEQAAR